MTITHPTLSARVQRKYKHEAKIKATYDAASDKTTLAMWPYDVRRNNDDRYESIAIAAGVTFAGKSLDSTPRFVEFGVLSQSRLGWLFKKDRHLVAVVDGDRFHLGEMNLVTARTFTIGATYFREDLNLILPYDVYMKMANAKKVVLQVGQEVMALANDHLEALRDLGSQIAR
jgi:hypothetical protein